MMFFKAQFTIDTNAVKAINRSDRWFILKIIIIVHTKPAVDFKLRKVFSHICFVFCIVMKSVFNIDVIIEITNLIAEFIYKKIFKI